MKLCRYQLLMTFLPLVLLYQLLRRSSQFKRDPQHLLLRARMLLVVHVLRHRMTAPRARQAKECVTKTGIQMTLNHEKGESFTNVLGRASDRQPLCEGRILHKRCAKGESSTNVLRRANRRQRLCEGQIVDKGCGRGESSTNILPTNRLTRWTCALLSISSP
jgi:hypothetical protein